jgi:two-component system KDP operon response regulator KdpE
VLVVDDEPAILRAAQVAFGAQGFEVVVAGTGTQGVAKASATSVQLIVLDLGLPDMDGLEVIRRVRAVDPHVPIIVLSAWEDVDTKIRALDLGADDYVEKPFSMPELLARIRVVLRRRTAADDAADGIDGELLVRGPITMDLARRTVEVHGSQVELTRTQFDLLRCFMRHPNRVLTHRAIATEVWGAGSDVDPANMRVVVSQIRKRIEDAPAKPKLIRTVLGIGYTFEP